MDGIMEEEISPRRHEAIDSGQWTVDNGRTWDGIRCPLSIVHCPLNKGFGVGDGEVGVRGGWS